MTKNGDDYEFHNENVKMDQINRIEEFITLVNNTTIVNKIGKWGYKSDVYPVFTDYEDFLHGVKSRAAKCIVNRGKPAKSEPAKKRVSKKKASSE